VLSLEKIKTMEIAKEKFIETFKKECEKAIALVKPESFRTVNIGDTQEELTIEVISNDKVSFYASKMSNFDEGNTFAYSGKILFGGFVDYKSIDLNAEEFNSIYDYFYECELKARLAAKNKIISEGEIALSQVL
jgi:flavorubredoxin